MYCLLKLGLSSFSPIDCMHPEKLNGPKKKKKKEQTVQF